MPLEVPKCRVDQRLAIDTRHQRAGPDHQVERPETARAGDIGDRLLGGAALDQRPECIRHGAGQVEQQGIALDFQGMGEQQFRIESRGGEKVKRSAACTSAIRASVTPPSYPANAGM